MKTGYNKIKKKDLWSEKLIVLSAENEVMMYAKDYAGFN